jgi:hypothetical protein
MREWVRAVAMWWNRRRRFAEEWAFHEDIARRELQGLGMSRAEARQHSAGRLGRRSLHRRAALREIGGDLRGLAQILPLRRTLRSPYLAPVVMALTTSLLLACNPFRRQVLESMSEVLRFSGAVHLQRLIPLTPSGTVPTMFAVVTLWALLLGGVGRMTVRISEGGGWRLPLYSLALLAEMMVAGSVVWATGMQILLARSWGADGIQGMALLLYLVGYAWGAWWALGMWWRDVDRRCPICLWLPGMPEERGKECDVLVEPREVESICLHGHGLAIESRWRRRFESDKPTAA